MTTTSTNYNVGDIIKFNINNMNGIKRVSGKVITVHTNNMVAVRYKDPDTGTNNTVDVDVNNPAIHAGNATSTLFKVGDTMKFFFGKEDKIKRLTGEVITDEEDGMVAVRYKDPDTGTNNTVDVDVNDFDTYAAGVNRDGNKLTPFSSRQPTLVTTPLGTYTDGFNGDKRRRAQDLSALSARALVKHAEEMGIDEAAIDAADEAEDRKGALVELIGAWARTYTGGFNGGKRRRITKKRKTKKRKTKKRKTKKRKTKRN